MVVQCMPGFLGIGDLLTNVGGFLKNGLASTTSSLNIGSHNKPSVTLQAIESETSTFTPIMQPTPSDINDEDANIDTTRQSSGSSSQSVALSSLATPHTPSTTTRTSLKETSKSVSDKPLSGPKKILSGKTTSIKTILVDDSSITHSATAGTNDDDDISSILEEGGVTRTVTKTLPDVLVQSKKGNVELHPQKPFAAMRGSARAATQPALYGASLCMLQLLVVPMIVLAVAM
ncbi:hypothetical protein GGF37_002771 [Kickxella alabastrina]|nr:hypothetical protein GGF37_002771 [Kickxella alabastrina]